VCVLQLAKESVTDVQRAVRTQFHSAVYHVKSVRHARCTAVAGFSSPTAVHTNSSDAR